MTDEFDLEWHRAIERRLTRIEALGWVLIVATGVGIAPSVAAAFGV